MMGLLDEEELMFASKLLVRDNGMSTIRLACTKEHKYLLRLMPGGGGGLSEDGLSLWKGKEVI